MEDIPKILKKNPQLVPHIDNVIRNLIIISEFVIVLKSKKTTFHFFTVLVKILNYFFKLKMESTLRTWSTILLKNLLNHMHFEYNRIEMSLSKAMTLIGIIIDILLSTELHDFETISILISICKKI